MSRTLDPNETGIFRQKFNVRNDDKLKLRWDVIYNLASHWNGSTLTNLTVSGNSLVITSGQLTGNIVTPALNDSLDADGKRKDVSVAKLLSWDVDNTSTTSTVLFYVSNDGGSRYISVLNQDSLYYLNTGKEVTKQSKYNDLRVKVILSRASVSDTSPQLNNFHLVYGFK